MALGICAQQNHLPFQNPLLWGFPSCLLLHQGWAAGGDTYSPRNQGLLTEMPGHLRNHSSSLGMSPDPQSNSHWEQRLLKASLMLGMQTHGRLAQGQLWSHKSKPVLAQQGDLIS